VTFKHKLRDEQAFASLELLKQQIDADLRNARRWFSESI
jgi:FAD synthase